MSAIITTYIPNWIEGNKKVFYLKETYSNGGDLIATKKKVKELRKEFKGDPIIKIRRFGTYACIYES